MKKLSLIRCVCHVGSICYGSFTVYIHSLYKTVTDMYFNSKEVRLIHLKIKYKFSYIVK